MSRVLVPAREEDADQVGSYACHLVAASPSQRPLRRRGVLMKRLFIGTVTVAAALAVNPTRAEHLPSLCPGRVVLRVDATDASGGSFYFVVRGRLLIIANQGLTLQAARGRCHEVPFNHARVSSRTPSWGFFDFADWVLRVKRRNRNARQ